ncbi:MAG: fimbrillin family protein [Bacteroidaceae bacterium]|nr:fimbrillin family protein [Bacteroidaceae bacterium]
MKKLLYLLPVAALAMASCSNDDSAGIEQSAQQLATADQLMLRPAVGGASTRIAGFNSVQDLDKFHIDITGTFRYGSGENTVTVNSISDNLESKKNFRLDSPLGENQLYYWNDATTNASFSAYNPIGLDISTEKVIKNDRSEQVDYLVAYNQGTKNDFRSGVPLNFQHVTSQINVQATNKDYAKVNIAVKAIRLVNVRNTATLSLPTVSTVNGVFSWADYTPWSLTNQTTDEFNAQSSTAYPIQSLKADALSLNFGDPHFLLPQQLTAATVTATENPTWSDDVKGNAIAFLIKVTSATKAMPESIAFEAEEDKDTEGYQRYYIYPTAEAMYAQDASSVTGYAWAYVPVDTKWEPGKRYIYTINFAEGAYGNIDPQQNGETDETPNGTPDPNKGKTNEEPGTEIDEVDVPLTFTVTVEDWIDVNEAKNL